MSLVELMVGITIGLFVVAAASTLMVNQLSDNRRLLVETQIQQDLRATMDIITRQMRRAGALDSGAAQAGLATSTGAGGSESPHNDMTPIAVPSSDVLFSYYRNAAEQGTLRFHLDSNIIRSRVGGGLPQELTDSNVLKVTAFTVTPVAAVSSAMPCPKLCADTTATCWPQLVVRDYAVSITAEATNDRTVRRSLTSTVRLRNDWVRFNGPAALSPVCPL